MPHIIVKLWPGKSEERKKRLEERITNDVTSVLNCGDESVSVSFEEIAPDEWRERVCRPEILGKPHQLFRKPGYTM